MKKNGENKKFMNLYKSNNYCECHIFKTEEEWKNNRIHGIGGSDASALVGKNKYKTNKDLWFEKNGLIVNDISNEATEYGKKAEDPIRKLFALKHPEFDVQYMENCQLQSRLKPYRTYSPDGLIYEKESGRKGIYEGKTTLIQNTAMYNEWKDGVPMHYFIQTLHGMLVDDEIDFVVFYAELRFAWERNTELVERTFTREEHEDDLAWLDEEEDKQWWYYENKIEPSLVIDF